MKIDAGQIELIVREVLERLEVDSTSGSVNKPGLLVVNLTDEKVFNRLCEHWNAVRESDTELSGEFEQVVIFQADQNLIVKGALGLDIEECRAFSRGLLQGKSITLIPSKEMEWLVRHEKDMQTSSPYHQHLRKSAMKLESFGVRIETLDEFLRGVEDARPDGNSDTFTGRLLTEAEVRNSAGPRILISKATIVTPLARDAAKESGKTICCLE